MTANDMDDATVWLDRFADRRGRRVIFMAHCLLNENTRYLGGACHAGAVPTIVAPCVEQGIGIVQLPCPEAHAWGGVLKRRLLWFYGSHMRVGTRTRRWLVLIALWFTRRIYHRLAADAAAQIKDYQQAGCKVLGVIGVDGSPSCGVYRTLRVEQALDRIGHLDLRSATSRDVNAIVKEAACAGDGLYVRLLRRQLSDCPEPVPFEAHDLLLELEGSPQSSPVHALVQRAAAVHSRD